MSALPAHLQSPVANWLSLRITVRPGHCSADTAHTRTRLTDHPFGLSRFPDLGESSHGAYGIRRCSFYRLESRLYAFIENERQQKTARRLLRIYHRMSTREAGIHRAAFAA